MDKPPLPTRRGPPIDVNKLYEASRHSPLPVKPDDEPGPTTPVSCLHNNLSRLAEPGNAPRPVTSPCTVQIREGEPVAAGGIADSILCTDLDYESDQGELPSDDRQETLLPVTVEGELEAGLFEADGPSSEPQEALRSSRSSTQSRRKCRMLPRKIPDVPKSYQVNVVKPDRQVRFAETIRLHAEAKRPRLREATDDSKHAASGRNGGVSAGTRAAREVVDNRSSFFSLDSAVSFDTVPLNSSSSSLSSTFMSSDSDSDSSSSSRSDISLHLPTNLVDYAPMSAMSLGIAPTTVQIKQRSGPKYQPPRARPTSFFINSDSDDDTSSSSSSSEDEAAVEERRALMASQRTNRYISRKVALGLAEQLQRWAQQTAAAQAAATQCDAAGTRIDAPKPKSQNRSRASGFYDDMQRSHSDTDPNALGQVGDRLYTYGPWPPARQDTQPSSAASAIIRPLSAFLGLAFCAIPLPFVPRLPALLDVYALVRAMTPEPAPNVASSSRSRSNTTSARPDRHNSAVCRHTGRSSTVPPGKNATGANSGRNSTASSRRGSVSSSASSGSSAPPQRIVTPPMLPTPVNIPVPDIVITDYDQEVEDALLRQMLRQRMIAQGGKVKSLRSFAQEIRETYEPQRLERSRARILSSPNYQGFNDIRHLSVPPARRRAPANASRDARKEGSQASGSFPAPSADVARGGLIYSVSVVQIPVVLHW